MSLFSPNLSGFQKRYAALATGGGDEVFPSDLGITQNWWTAKQGISVADGEVIPTWEDRIVGQIASVEAESEYGLLRPTYRANSGEPYLEFDGIRNFLRTGVTNQFGDFAVIGVVKITEDTHGAGDRIIDKGAAAGSILLYLNNQLYLYFNGAPAIIQNLPTFQWLVLGMGRIGENCYLWMNGETYTYPCVTTLTSSEMLRIGSSQGDISGTTLPKMDFKDLVVVDGALSSGDLEILTSYYQAEYGLDF